jgi:serine/threonine protein kinase
VNAPTPSRGSIFCAAVEIASAEERAAFIERMCADDAELRQHVRELVDAHFQAGSFLEQPADARNATGPFPPPEGPVADPLQEGPGTRIGPYKLLQLLGEGGMGAVWMAEQTEPVRRRVALKVIKPGMDSAQVIARFDAERQALALMDHPNIARVLDAGTTANGRPFFVMELVKGTPITQYCDEHRLTPRQRLELFVPVCQAIQHAHHKGIIHRDIKPSNILIAPSEAQPVVKVIDFGIAKAIGQQLTERTLFTAFGAVIGTPEYMSPEQAELNNQDVDTRSDIYSLGVLLYELLTGTPPLRRERLQSAAFLEVLRLVREEETPRPSQRLSTSQTLPQVAANRGLQPAQLTRLVRGELDWIVLKALEKDRNRRYESASAFAADLGRYLNDEPVQACPPSLWYRLRKFRRRHQASLLAIAFLLFGLMALVVVLGVANYRIAQKQREVEANLRKAREAVDDYFIVVGSSPLLDTPGLEPLRRKLLETGLRYYEEFIRAHADDAELEADVAAAHHRVSQIIYLNGEPSDAWFPHLRAAVDISERLIAAGRDTPEVQRRLGNCYLGGGDIGYRTGGTINLNDVRPYMYKQIAILERFVQANPTEPIFQNALAATYMYLGSMAPSFDEGIACSDKAIAIWETLKRLHPDVPGYAIEVARTYDKRARQLKGGGRLQEAAASFDTAQQLARDLARDFPGRVSSRAWMAVSLGALGEAQQERNQPEEAVKSLSQACDLLVKITAESPAVPTYQNDLVRTYQSLAAAWRKLKKLDEAEAAERNALSILGGLTVHFPRMTGYRDSYLSAARELARSLEGRGLKNEATAVIRDAVVVYHQLASASTSSPEERLVLAENYQQLGNLLMQMGQRTEAMECFRRAVAIREKLSAAAPANIDQRAHLAHSYRIVAFYLDFTKDRQEREKLLTQAVALLEEVVQKAPNPDGHRYYVADTCLALAAGCLADKRFKEANGHHRKAIDTLEGMSLAGLRKHWQMLARSYQECADALASAGQSTERENLVRRALAFCDQSLTRANASERVEIEQLRREVAKLNAAGK